jgi:hypothetical protein
MTNTPRRRHSTADESLEVSHPPDEDRTTGTRLWCSLKVPSIAAWAPKARPKCLLISIWATPSILIFWFVTAEATEEVNLQGFQALFRTRTGDPLLTIEQRGGNGGQGREAAGTEVQQEEGIA